MTLSIGVWGGIDYLASLAEERFWCTSADGAAHAVGRGGDPLALILAAMLCEPEQGEVDQVNRSRAFRVSGQ